MTETYAIILAGGAGTRLWPLSRRNRPKQLLKLLDHSSLVQIAYERLQGLFDAESIFVVANGSMVPALHEELPRLPVTNLIAEPEPRDTANAIGLAASLFARTSPSSKMLVTTADHVIQPVDRFQESVRRALGTIDARPQALVTFGVRPDSAHTGYGYLHLGELLGDGAHRVVAFKEKPDAQTAAAYLRDGGYRWNSGMFAWRVDTFLAEFERFLPENAALLKHIAKIFGEDGRSDEIAEYYGQLPRVSIDYGVMEHATDVLSIELPCEWKDVGSWDVVAELAVKSKGVSTSNRARAIAVDAANNFVYSEDDHLVVTVGVEDLIVVRTPDVTLICHKDQLSNMRDVVEKQRAQFGEEFD